MNDNWTICLCKGNRQWLFKVNKTHYKTGNERTIYNLNESNKNEFIPFDLILFFIEYEWEKIIQNSKKYIIEALREI